MTFSYRISQWTRVENVDCGSKPRLSLEAWEWLLGSGVNNSRIWSTLTPIAFIWSIFVWFLVTHHLGPLPLDILKVPSKLWNVKLVLEKWSDWIVGNLVSLVVDTSLSISETSGCINVFQELLSAFAHDSIQEYPSSFLKSWILLTTFFSFLFRFLWHCFHLFLLWLCDYSILVSFAKSSSTSCPLAVDVAWDSFLSILLFFLCSKKRFQVQHECTRSCARSKNRNQIYCSNSGARY